MKEQELLTNKQPIATGLTPEAPMGERNILRQKAKMHHQIVKSSLTKQMEKKQVTKAQEIKQK